MSALRVAMIGSRGVPATVGGVETSVEELAAHLVDRGLDVTVYCRNSYCTTRVPTYRGIRLRYLPSVDTKHLEAISHSLLATLDATLRRYDVVHFHALGPGLCAPVAHAAGLNVVTTVQALDFRGGKWGRFARGVLQFAARVAAHAPDRTIVVSRLLAQHFADVYGAQTTIIPNGVDPPSDDAIRANDRASKDHVLYLGRLVPEKGAHTLIEAYRGLVTDVPLVIAGPPTHSGDYERRLRALAGDDPRISFAGAVHGEEKADLVRRTYAFCHPSTHEGQPIALLEMMSEAICPVVSDIPEHLEVVSPGGRSRPAAIVFRAGDPDSLREALAQVLSHRELVLELGRAARQLVVTRYSWSDVAAAVESVYRDVVR